MSDATMIDRLLELAKFRGDAAEALIALRGYLAQTWPETMLAVLYTLETDPQAARLAGLIGADGTELLRGQDAGARAVRLPRFDDSLAQACCTGRHAQIIDLAAGEHSSGLATTLHGPSTLAVLPIDPDQRHGYRLLLSSGRPRQFRDLDLDSAWREARMAFAVLSAGFSGNVAQRQHREIEGLADIQRLLQPERPQIRGLDFALHWQPAATAAGDYYDLMRLSHVFDDYQDCGVDAWGTMVADVSGHGAAAAMEAVQFDAILRTYGGTEPPGGAAGAITYANRYFFSRRQRAHFLTAFSIGARPDMGSLQFVNAGHCPALRRRGGMVDWLGRDEDAGIPLGILRDHRWNNVQTDLRAGDLFVLYTDGIVEARDAAGRMFGADRVAALTAQGSDDPQAVLVRIRDALHDHQDNDIGRDDQTLLVLRQEKI